MSNNLYNQPLVWDPERIRWWQVMQAVDNNTPITRTDNGSGYYWATSNQACRVIENPATVVAAIDSPVTVVEAEPEKPKKDPFDPRNWGIAG